MIGQMLNDIADYVPASYGQKSAAKKVEDAYSDLRNGNFTLPFLFAVKDMGMIEYMLGYKLYENGIQEQWLFTVSPSYRECVIPMLREFSQNIKILLRGNRELHTIQFQDFANIVYSRRYLKYIEK